NPDGHNTYFWVWNGTPSILPIPGTSTAPAGGDTTYYVLGCASPVSNVCSGVTAATLDRNYERSSCSPCTNQGFLIGYNQASDLVGWGALPYGEGILGQGFGLAAIALDGVNNTARDNFRGFNDDVSAWLLGYGIDNWLTGLFQAVFP